MRFRTTLGLVLGLGLLAACDATKTSAPIADTTHVAVADHGWQMTVKSSMTGGLIPISAIRTDVYDKLTLQNFVISTGMIYDLKHFGDSVPVGYAYQAGLQTDNLVNPTWTITGNMSIFGANTDVSFGLTKSLFEISSYDVGFKMLGDSLGDHAIEKTGDDFRFTQKVATKGVYFTSMTSAFYKEARCSGVNARNIVSNGTSESVADSLHFQFQGRRDAPDIIVTCNRAVSALGNRAATIDGSPVVKVMDYFRSLLGH